MHKLHLLVTAASFVLGANAMAADAIQKQLEGNYAAMSRGFIAKDLRPMEGFLTPDFVVQDLDGKLIPRAQILQGYQAQMKMLSDVKWVRTIKGISHQGDVYFTMVDGDINAIVKGPDHRDHKLRLLATSKDSWVKTGSKWTLKKTVLVKRTVTMDGQSMKRR